MELVGDDVDYKEPFLTGFFRDGKRKIDMVIVSKDTASEELETMKMTFLMNAIDIGLEMEIEAGASELHSDLNFIKIHAPEDILQYFGLYYNIKKFFKASHLEFAKSEITQERDQIKIIRRWHPSQTFSTFERSQIVYKILLSVTFGHPQNYVGINQLIDRNIFIDIYPLHDGPVHLVREQTALELTGRQALFYNWCGYENLFRPIPINLVREYLGERIGFFFAFYQFYNCFLLLLAVLGIFVFSKNYDITDRNLQINEHGMLNTYREIKQIGIGTRRKTYTYSVTDIGLDWGGWFIKTVIRIRKLTATYKQTFSLSGEVYYTDLPVCPKCRDMVGCPFRFLTAYTRELQCKVFLDNPLGYYIAFATIIWGLLLYLLWTRRENYLYWMWETNEEDSKSLTRPEYRLLPKRKKTSRVSYNPFKLFKRKGKEERVISSKVEMDSTPQNQRKPIFRGLLEFLVIFFAIATVCLLYPAMLIETSNKMLNRARYVEEFARTLYPENATYEVRIKHLNPHIGFRAIERINHFITDFVGSLNGVLIMGFEMLWWMVLQFLLKYHKPRTEFEHERMQTTNLFGLTILINFILIAFYAFVKGSLYTYPDDQLNWRTPLQLGMQNCGLLHCADEVFLVFTSTFKTKLFLTHAMRNLRRLPTDQQRDLRGSEPCWERELRLLPVREHLLTYLYNKLFLQIAAVTLFIAVFPLTAIIAFLWNLWNIRYLASVFVVHGRRPLLTQTWGLGAWKEILFILPYLACFTNAVYLVRNNSLMDRKFNKKYWSHHNKRRFLVDYYMGLFNLSDYKWTQAANIYAGKYKANFIQMKDISFCLFPGQYNRMLLDKKAKVEEYVPAAGKWYIHWRQALFVITFSLLCVAVGMLLHTLIKPESQEVRDTRRVEEAVRQYGRDEPKTKSD